MKPSATTECFEKDPVSHQQCFLDACNEMKETGISFNEAAEKYNIETIHLETFSDHLKSTSHFIPAEGVHQIFTITPIELRSPQSIVVRHRQQKSLLLNRNGSLPNLCAMLPSSIME